MERKEGNFGASVRRYIRGQMVVYMVGFTFWALAMLTSATIGMTLIISYVRVARDQVLFDTGIDTVRLTFTVCLTVKFNDQVCRYFSISLFIKL